MGQCDTMGCCFTENTTRRPVTITDKGNVYYNEVGADNGGYYDFSTVPKTAIRMDKVYDYVEKGRGKDGKIEQKFMVGVMNSCCNLLYLNEK
jgi:hypothetical protein